MLKRQDIIREYHQAIKELGIEPRDMVVGAGAACVLHGVREQTQDIDVAVADKLFDELLSTKQYTVRHFQTDEVLEYNSIIDIHRLSANIQINVIEGIHCYSVEQVLKQKQQLNRLKDQADIIALQRLLTN